VVPEANPMSNCTMRWRIRIEEIKFKAWVVPISSIIIDEN